MQIVMYAKRDNSANYGSLLQDTKLKVNVRQKDVWKGRGCISFATPEGRSRGKQRVLSADIKL